MSGVRRIVPLALGWEDLPKSVSVHGAPDARTAARARARPAVGGRRRLAAAGHGLQHRADPRPVAREPVPRRPDYAAVLPGPGEPIEEALERAGIPFDAIAAVGVSHLHLDHAGGLKLFAGRVPVHAQRRELEYGLAQPRGRTARDLPCRLRRPADRLADRRRGRRSWRPGVTAVLTAGHTPGHQSFVVELDPSVGGGGFVFAFDAADLTENIEQELADRRLHRRGAGGDRRADPTPQGHRRERGFRLVPGHDPRGLARPDHGNGRTLWSLKRPAIHRCSPDGGAVSQVCTPQGSRSALNSSGLLRDARYGRSCSGPP